MESEFNLVDWTNKKVIGHTTEAGATLEQDALIEGFYKAADLIEAFIQAKGQETLYSRQILEFIDGLR